MGVYHTKYVLKHEWWVGVKLNIQSVIPLGKKDSSLELHLCKSMKH